MYWKKHISFLLFLLSCFSLAHKAIGQSNTTYSYIYIQSDKELPFYVKFENEMQPRYGKNYCIISELDSGIADIQIVFQQNSYPPQKFAIQVPENGFRGFLLSKKGDAFSLYDLEQQFYLPAGNKASDDRMPSLGKSMAAPVSPVTKKEEPIKEKQNAPAQIKEAEEKPSKKEIAQTQQVKETPLAPQTPVAPKPSVVPPSPPATPKKQEPQFLDNLSLENNRTVNAGSTIAKPRNRMSVTNSDCPDALSEEAFADMEQRTNEKFGEDRLKYLLSKMDKCYTTAQARTLARTLSSDAERYTFLKRIYPRVSDQSVFPMLEREFTEPEWKANFSELFKH